MLSHAVHRSLWRFGALVMLLCAALPLHAADEVLVVEQDYNIIEQSKDGPQAKDIRQKLYIHKEFVCIDEFGVAKDVPVETVLIDLKDKKIYNLDHEKKRITTETFEARRKRIENRRKNAREDLEAQPEGPQRNRLENLYRALLDEKRKFKLEKLPDDKKTIAGVECTAVKVVDADNPQYVPLLAWLHPQIEMPYDNAEVLFLLQIIGERLSKYLHDNREILKNVPMELHLDLAAGGKLDTKVVSVNKRERTALASRGTLGLPDQLPKGYEEPLMKPVKPDEKDRPD